MRDPYSTLEVPRDASTDDIKRAFRRLAKELHPDLHPNDPVSARRFKDIAAAYDILSDEDKRRRADRDLAAESLKRRRDERVAPERPPAEGPAAEKAGEGGPDGFFGFKKMRDWPGESSFLRGGDIHYRLAIGFVDAALGTRKRLTLADHRSLEIVIPPGTVSGQTLRLKGQGHPGRFGLAAGDVLVEVTVEPHPSLTRRDQTIHLTLPITVPEAVQGATVVVPTIHGPVQLRIPSGSNTDTVLRLKGKGLPLPGGGAGDQLVTLKVVLPPGEDTEFAKIVEQWGRRRSYVVR